MNAYKPNLNDIMNLRKDLDVETGTTKHISPSDIKSCFSSGSGSVKVEKPAEEIIIETLKEELSLAKFSSKCIKNHRYQLFTIRFIVFEKETQAPEVCYENFFFKGDEKVANFSVDAETKLKGLNQKISFKDCQLNMESKTLEFEQKTFNASGRYLYRLNYSPCPELAEPCIGDIEEIEYDDNEKNFTATESDIYLQFFLSTEKIDGIFRKPEPFAIAPLLMNHETEALLLNEENFESKYLFVSVKENVKFGEAFDQIIKHTKHIKSLDEFKSEKISFLLLMHSDHSKPEFNKMENRQRSCLRVYKKLKEQMDKDISLSVFYLKTNKYYEKEFIVSNEMFKVITNERLKANEICISELKANICELKEEVRDLKAIICELNAIISKQLGEMEIMENMMVKMENMMEKMENMMENGMKEIQRQISIVVSAYPNLVVDSSETKKELTEKKEVTTTGPLQIGMMRTETAEAIKEDINLIEEKEEYPLLIQGIGRIVGTETAEAIKESVDLVEEKEEYHNNRLLTGKKKYRSTQEKSKKP